LGIGSIGNINIPTRINGNYSGLKSIFSSKEHEVYFLTNTSTYGAGKNAVL
jgi:hypothetical protein